MKLSATAYPIFFVGFFLFFLQANAQIPKQDLKIWLCADSGKILSGSGVSQWNDLSGNGYHLIQSTASNMPEFQSGVINDKAAVYFDGVNDNLEVLFNDTFAQPATYFVMWKAGSASQLEFIFDGATSGYRNAFYYDKGTNSFNYWSGIYGGYSYTITNDFSLHNIVFNGSSSRAYANGILKSTDNPGSQEMRGLRLGYAALSMFYFNGWITDFLYYNRVLTTTERQQVEEYLMDRVAPPVSLGPDMIISHGFCARTIDAGPEKKSYFWSTGANTQSIQVSQTGDYWVQTTDIFGRVSTDTVYIQFPFTPMHDRGLCMSDTVIINPGLNKAYTYYWNDASTDSILKVFNPGTYWVEITDSTTSHCSIRDSIIITADSFPVQANLGLNRSFCAGDKLGLQNVLVPVSTYAWSTGANTNQISISTSGEYRITATDVNGCVLRDTVSISIKGLRPRVGFSNLATCEGVSMEFTDTSNTTAPDGIATRTWIFHPGDTSHLVNPTYAFPGSGNFNVKLIIVSDSGCVADTTRQVHVLKNPLANFKPIFACTGQPFDFVSLSSSSEGLLNTWVWNFGDGNTATGDTASYQYANSGTYSVRLVVINQYACRDTVYKELVVRNTPPVNFTGEDGCFGTQIQFQETTNVSPQEAIITRHWNFGDGEMSIIKNPLHLYSNTGNFPVKLYNKSLNGCADSITKIITVHPLPVAGFTHSLPCDGNPVDFADTSTFGDTRKWTINGVDYFDSLVSVIFPDTGTYHVELISYSPFLCKSVTNKDIYVFPSPVTSFTFNPEYGIPPLDVQFVNTTTGISNLLWNFGDGTTSYNANPIHQFTSEAIYSVSLTTQNSFGCHNTDNQPVYVIPSTLDLVIENLELTDTSEYVKPLISIFNNGTRNVRKIMIDAGFTSTPGISKVWTGLLLPGQTIIYDPDLYFRKPSDKQVFCISINALDAVGQNDVAEGNNYSCYSLASGFSLVQLFPNPADDKIYVDINLPLERKIKIEVVNAEGKLVFTQDSPVLNEGINRLSVGLEGAKPGIYNLRVIFEDKTENQSFIIGQ